MIWSILRSQCAAFSVSQVIATTRDPRDQSPRLGPLTRLRPLKRHAQSEPHREWVDRLEMDVVDRRCLVRQLRGVEIVNVVGAGIVEQVENVELQSRLLGEFVADAQIDERRALPQPPALRSSPISPIGGRMARSALGQQR